MDVKDKGPTFGKRHVQVLLMFTLLTVAIGMRAQLSVALVAMTDKTSSPNPDVPVFNWDNTSVLLSSFYWGYLWFQVLAGNLGRVYGTKYFLMGAMIVNATICCLIPAITTKWGSTGLMVIRALQGLSQGFFYPSLNNVLAKWSPSSERASLGNLATSGYSFGTILAMPLVGVLSSTWYGWPLSFYLYGSLGYLWVIAHFFFGASSPASHSSISEAEKEYIQSNLDMEGHKEKVPWKQIICNVPFWATFTVQVAQYFSNLVLLLETPTYFNKILKLDLTSNGFLSAAPSLASFILVILFGYVADYLIFRNVLSLLWTRKIFTIIGSVAPAVAVLVLGYLPEDDTTFSVLMLIIAAGSSMACGPGACINHIDLSPNFAGLLLGIINSCGTVVSIFGPIAVQFIVKDETNKSQWRIIFIIASIIYVVPSIMYTFLASADVQAYDSSKGNAEEERKARLKKHSVISILSM